MTLLPNILVSTNLGTVAFKGPIAGTAEVGVAPFIPGGSIANLVPSATGLTNYVDFGLACAFRISDLQNALLFCGQHDAYRIDKVTITLQYLSNTASVSGTALLPTFYMYNDPDDEQPPGSLQSISAKQGVRKVYPGNNNTTVFSHSIVPRASALAYGNPGNPSVPNIINKQHQWLDCTGQANTNNSIPHYAFKMWVTDWETSSVAQVCNVLKFQFTYHVSFRGPLSAN
jgi:hypothetical protein